MIRHPISNRDLMRSVMYRVASAEVRFRDPTLQMFANDEEAGLCRMEIHKLPELVEIIEVLGEKGKPKKVKQTTQRHEVVVEYFEPELEFEKRLSM